MDQLFARLSHVTYEIFGVLLPGFVGLLFLAAMYASLGDVPASLVVDAPSVTPKRVHDHPYGLVDVVMLTVACYFVGHLMTWLTRRHGKTVTGKFSALMRVLKCLVFRIPKPAASFNKELEPVFQAVAAHVGIPQGPAQWRQYYPIAKIMLAERLSNSLLSTYQNKYTLHRAVVGAAVLWFWSSFVSLVVLWWWNPILPDPRWIPLLLNPVAAVIVIWGFSGSFEYYWRLWGDSVITESYAVLRGLTRL